MNPLEERLLTLDELLQMPPVSHLLESLLVSDSLAVLYGPPKSGKSFVALSMAWAVASGSPWLAEYPVAQGPVIYNAAEGVSGFPARICALQRGQVGLPEDFRFLRDAVQLGDRHKDLSDLLSLVAENRPRLVVVDTLARSIVGLDESSSRDMGCAIDAIDAIRQAGSGHTTVLVVHHSGKDVRKGMRGSNALVAAADTVLQLRSSRSRGLQLHTEAQKDMAEAPPISLELEAAESSMRVVLRRTDRSTDCEVDQDLEEMEVLAALRRLGGAAQSGRWEEQCKCSRATFHRRRKRLLERDLVESLGKGRYAVKGETP
ncbi:MAG: AAA family ATPase [Actinomycetota bacterium]